MAGNMSDASHPVRTAGASSRVFARYMIETSLAIEETAAAMAGEQSTGTFVKLSAGDTPTVRRQDAKVEHIDELGEVESPSLDGARTPHGKKPVWRRAMVEISWPLESIGSSLVNVLPMVFGNLLELNQLSGIRLLDVDLPEALVSAYPGPAFGVDGTRRLAGVERLPLVGTIVKPSVGLTADETAELTASLIDAGIDFIKDDELQSDGTFCPFEDRVRAVMRVIDEHADRTGRKPMYAFNLTGEIDEMKRRHDLVADAGGSCVMVSINAVGLAGVTALRRHAGLPIHAHRNGWGLYYRSPAMGMDYLAYQKLWRVAGVDHMHVNGLRNKFAEQGSSSIASARACLTPLSDEDPRIVMPVFSSGQSAEQVPETLSSLGSMDLIYCCGGGIMGHPMGVAAGVESIREAWEASSMGESLADRASRSPALSAALSFFG